MSYGFKVVIEGDYACFTRPEMKVERVSYDVPTPGALEGLLKSIYWKPSIQYRIDTIQIFKPIKFANIRRNEVKEKVKHSKVKAQMQGKEADPCIYTAESRSQRASMVLKDVKYGVAFHFELTGKKSEEETDAENKHYNIIKRRLEKGQFFRTPCLGCSEFPAKRVYLVDTFDNIEMDADLKQSGDIDFGFMSYRVDFKDKGEPINGDWDHPIFSDKADTVYYRPHMVNGIIDVQKYTEGLKC